MKIFIVEDDSNNILLIKELLKRSPIYTKIVGEAGSVAKAVGLLELTKPDLVFLDIMLKDGTGFDVLTQLGTYDFQVVFITAHDQYAIKAIKKQAIDYILKPIKFDELNLALNRAKAKIADNFKLSFIEESDLQQFNFKTYQGTNVIKPLIDIVYFEADGSYTKVAFKSGENIIISKNIGEVESEIINKNFFRCHHSFIVNKKFILNVELDRTSKVTCEGGDIIPVSQRKKKLFIEFLKEEAR